jgi:hypothetical protein
MATTYRLGVYDVCDDSALELGELDIVLTPESHRQVKSVLWRLNAHAAESETTLAVGLFPCGDDGHGCSGPQEA